MNEVTISKNRLVVLCVAIIALFILVIFLFCRTPPSPPGKNFLDNLNQERTSIVAIIDKEAKVTFFNKEDLSSLESCGELKDNTIPPECGVNGNNRVELLNLSTLTVLGVRGSPESPESMLFSANRKFYHAKKPKPCVDSAGNTYPPPC